MARSISAGSRAKPLLGPARKASNIGLQISERGQQQFVGRMFHQHFVARLQDRRHGEIVRHGSAVGSHNVFRRHAAVRGQRLLQRWIAVVAARASGVKVFELHRQAGERIADQAAGGQVVTRAGASWPIACRPNSSRDSSCARLLSPPVQIRRNSGRQNQPADQTLLRMAVDGAGHDRGAGNHEKSRWSRDGQEQDIRLSRRLRSRRRKTNSVAAVSPKKMKSDEIT